MIQVTAVDKDVPLKEMIDIVSRDGGVIIKGLFGDDVIDELYNGCAPDFNDPVGAKRRQLGFEDSGQAAGTGFFPDKVIHSFQLVAKAPQAAASIIDHPIYVGLNNRFLGGEAIANVAGKVQRSETGWILNIANGMQVSSGAKAQVLHRDQSIADRQHSYVNQEGSIDTSSANFLVAGTDTTIKNGATRVVPGSHIWNEERNPTEDEITQVVMEKGDAFWYLGSVLHGAGQNRTEPDDPTPTRRLYGFSACKDFLRAEENQMLAVPLSTAKRLSPTVQARLGWVKAAGGAGFYGLGHPRDTFPGWKATEV